MLLAVFRSFIPTEGNQQSARLSGEDSFDAGHGVEKGTEAVNIVTLPL